MGSIEEHNKAFMRAFVDAGNRQDMSAVWNSIAPDAVLPDMVKFGQPPNLEGYKKFLTAFYAALPDAILHIDDMIAEGNKVGIWYTITGTHKGVLRGIQPTGKQVKYQFIVLYTVEKDHIVTAKGLADDLGLLKQLGAAEAD